MLVSLEIVAGCALVFTAFKVKQQFEYWIDSRVEEYQRYTTRRVDDLEDKVEQLESGKRK